MLCDVLAAYLRDRLCAVGFNDRMALGRICWVYETPRQDLGPWPNHELRHFLTCYYIPYVSGDIAWNGGNRGSIRVCSQSVILTHPERKSIELYLDEPTLLDAINAWSTGLEEEIASYPNGYDDGYAS